MKILHTSDWHLGHTLYNYDRSREQQAFLKQLTRIVAEEMPDAMVVSGDIYHYSTPSASTQKMYTDGWYARNSQGMSRNDNCGNCRKPRQQFEIRDRQ